MQLTKQQPWAAVPFYRGKGRGWRVKPLARGHGASRSVAGLAPPSPTLLAASSTPFTHPNPPASPSFHLNEMTHPHTQSCFLQGVRLPPRSLSGRPALQGGSGDGSQLRAAPAKAPRAADCIITHPLSGLIAPTSPK